MFAYRPRSKAGHAWPASSLESNPHPLRGWPLVTCVHGASRSSTFSAVDQGDPRLREREGVDDCVTSRGKIPGKKIKTTKLVRSLEAIDGIGRLLMFSWAWRTEALTDDRLSSGRRDSDPCNTKIVQSRGGGNISNCKLDHPRSPPCGFRMISFAEQTT